MIIYMKNCVRSMRYKTIEQTICFNITSVRYLNTLITSMDYNLCSACYNIHLYF